MSQFDDNAVAGGSFAEKLRRLFDSVRREDGTKYSPRDVAQEITNRGHKLSKTYLYVLLRGESEPSHALVQAIADFFDVPLDYFSQTERGRELQRQYELLAALGDNNVQKIAHRARGLTSDQLRNVLAYIDFEASRDRGRDHPSE